MRVFVASLATETNTYSPLYVDRRAFEKGGTYYPPGTHPDTPTLCSGPMVAAREAAKRDGFTLIEGTATWAEPAGPVSREAYESLRDEILGQLKAALPVDVVLFGLHGSMVAVGYDDCEGDLISRARAMVGKDCVIGAELDPHNHMTPLMMDTADVLVCFKEVPHTDFLARARDLTDLCLRTARGEIKPVLHRLDPRGSYAFMTSREPGRGLVDRMLAMEGKDGILSISIAHGFSAADVPEMGTKILVYTDGDNPRGAELAREIMLEIMSWPDGGVTPLLPPAEAIAAALAIEGGPVILADRWDNPGGGVAGDSTVMITEFLARPEIPAAVGAMWDPVAVQLCRAAGVGSKIPLRFGGKAAATSGPPIDAEVEILGTTEDLRVPFEQSWVSLGAAAAIRIGYLDVVLASGRAQTFSPPVFTNLGIDLSTKKIVVVKSSNHFYAAFAPIAAKVLYLDSGGPYPSDIRKMSFKKLKRPFYPLDPRPWP